MLGGGLGATVVGLHAQQAEALQAVPQQRDGDGEGAEEADGHRREHRRDRRELRVLGRQRRRRRRVGGGALGDAELELLALGAGEVEGAVALQLPMVFGLNEWLKEMKRMASQMDEETFEQNVLGLFECFATADDVDGAPSPAPVVLGMPKTVNNNSSAAEDAEDKKENGLAAMRGALKSWRATTATTPRGTSWSSWCFCASPWSAGQRRSDG